MDNIIRILIKHKLWFFSLVVLVISVCGGGLLLGGALDEAGNAGHENEDVGLCPVPTAIAMKLPKYIARDFPGRVRACRRVDLAFDFGGVLVELNALEGSVVKKGYLLAKLDQRDSLNALNMAQANYNDAVRTNTRAKILYGKKIISLSEYDKTQTVLEIAKAELSVRKKALEDTVIVAPFSGVIAARYMEDNEYVKSREAVLTFMDISRLEVVIQVPERLIVHGGIGALRNLKVNFDADNDNWFNAQVKEYRVQPDEVTRTYDVIVTLVPPENLKLLPGMAATVKMETKNPRNLSSDISQNIISIPPEAVWSEDGEYYVWVVDDDSGEVKKTRVVIGSLTNESIQILSGLNNGDCVAVAGLHVLQTGIKVRPRIAGKEGLEG